MATFVKLPPPRQLTQKETLDSLDHWKAIFRSYFRRDSIFKQFLATNMTWNPASENFGLSAENDMTASERCDALKDFLNTLAGFLPHSYLTAKLLNTQKLEDCWNIIEEHYNVKVTSETFLDFENVKKNPDENYRQFYERLLQHSRLHLAPINAEVGKIVNTEDDKMTISLMNHVALQWLRKIDVQLIQIVKTEYSTELRSNEQLAHLVPRIAPNIDSLLSRYAASSTVSKVTLNTANYENDYEETEKVWRIRSRGNGRGGRSSRGGRGGLSKRGNNSQQYCAGCYSLGKELNTFINFKHSPFECTRQDAVTRLLQLDIDDNHPSESEVDFNEAELNDENGKNNSCYTDQPTLNPLQNNPDFTTKNSCQETVDIPTNLTLTINLNQNPGDGNQSSHSTACSGHTTFKENKAESHFSDVDNLIRKVRNIEKRKHLWSKDSVRKESSPMVSALLNGRPCTPTIDEGSEINCIDADFASKCNLNQVPTNCSATAAGSLAMTVTGQTLNNIILTISQEDTQVEWDLAKCAIVANLGVDILIGEPGKIDNFIVTKSYKQKIETKDKNGNIILLPYFKKKDESRYVCRAVKAGTLLPGDSLSIKVPIFLQNEAEVAVAPIRESDVDFLKPKVLKINQDKSVTIVNESPYPIHLKKNSPICDVTALTVLSCGKICKETKDQSHLQRPIIFSKSEANKSYTNDVKIDPDDQLAKVWKERFRRTCDRYSDVINPNPGRYNNHYGNVDCTIDFCSTPPPSVKARLPNYSTEKLKIMAEQMDKMEEMGVLAKPESVGIVPAFVVPSLLVPKPEKGEWRLVSDFTPLNIHIRKFETVSPGIEEAKRVIAKYKYNIEMDLSNYFWQGGMRKEDMQYLATPHPYKGLRVYTVEPQGLRNASEHSYEKLARIYGDLRQAEKMTCMADGLYVVGDTLQDLHESFMEVLDRARKCGLTFKPKKIVIAPKDTILFGWRKIGEGWRPMDHTVSPLTRAEEPSTVKQLRSFLGSYKQLTECITDYAVLLSPLEKAVAGLESAARIQWTPELSNSFAVAKDALNNIDTIFIPKPTDKLEVFVDYSQDKKAVGGKLIIKREDSNNIKRSLIGGHFSCKLDVHQKNWLPCEGEALGVKLICKHFSNYIRESMNITTVYTDNLPTVHAWRRMKTGAFSASARVASFLTGLSTLTVEVVHKPGKEMTTSDYNSRHPNSCTFDRCKICQFSYQMETIGDSIVYTVKSINATDVEAGNIKMPHSQRAAWLKVQSNDDAHRMFLSNVKLSKLPEKKKTKGVFTTIKRLHNLYRTGQVKIDFDGFVTVKHTDAAGNIYFAISVPTKFYPGLVNALHIKLNHPSKTQLQRLMSRHFYCAGQARIIEEVTATCTICASLKQLPTEIFSQSTTETPVFGANFSADVIRKDGQMIFLCREKLSQFTLTRLIPDETADSLRDSIVAGVIDFIPETGTTVQVDCAPGLQTLAAEAKLDGSILKKLGIVIDLGRVHNVNKNPVAENAIKEFHKERLRLNPAGGRISEIERSRITKNMNSRVRERGLTSKEMAFNRDQITNEVKVCDDNSLSKLQMETRIKRHPEYLNKTEGIFNVGDNVFLKADKSKLRGREAYKVVSLFQKNDEKWATIQKCETKFMSKEYDVKFSELFKVPQLQIKNLLDIDNAEDIVDNKEPVEQLEPFDFKVSKRKEFVTKNRHQGQGHPAEDVPIDKSSNLKKKICDMKLKSQDVDCIEKDTDNKEKNSEQEQPYSERPKRRAALKFQHKMKEILPCLKIKSNIAASRSSHGWKYEDWLKEIDDDPYYVIADHINVIGDDFDISGEDTLSRSETSKEASDPETPFGQFLRNLDDLPYQHRRTSYVLPPPSMLGMFPPADEEEMTWDNSTTPPAMRKITDEEVDEELNSAVASRELFLNDEESIVIEDLTSENSDDDVFFDGSILEVSINGRRKFSRSNPLRRQMNPREITMEDATTNSDADDEQEGARDTLSEATTEDDNQQRPRRNVKKINYAMLHKKGRE